MIVTPSERPMLNLPDVTLGCVDTRMPEMALSAMRSCMRQVRFADVILFTRPDHDLPPPTDPLRIVPLEHVTSIEAYSTFLVKGMLPYVASSHLLIVQWDGYIVAPEVWRPAFLDVDYIGAVWPQYRDAHRVGNGGFSLRSRKLLAALADDSIVPNHPEDVCIARTHRQLLESRWGIRFADEALAQQFSFERQRPLQRSFGFHGLSNMADLLDPSALQALIADAPPSIFSSTEARGFIKGLLRRGMKDLARAALLKRKEARAPDWSDMRLWSRLWMA